MTYLGRIAVLLLVFMVAGCEHLGDYPYCEHRCSEILLYEYTWGCPHTASSTSGEYVLLFPGYARTVEDLFTAETHPFDYYDWMPEDFGCQALQSAVFNDGSFVLACEINYDDGRGTNIYAQLFRPGGKAWGDLFLVNELAVRNNKIQDVSTTDQSHFVVLWKNLSPQGREPKLYAKIYGSNGEELTGEMQIDPQGTRDKTSGQVAGFEDGSFVIAWTEMIGEYPSSLFSMRAQRYNPEGNEKGGRITVYEDTELSSRMNLAGFKDKRFLLVYTTGDYTIGHSFSGQVYNLYGNKYGPEFTVIPSITDWYDPAPSVSTFADGGFVVSWTDEKPGKDESMIFVQRFNRHLTPQGKTINANQCRIPSHSCSEVMAMPDNSFLVFWQGLHQWEVCGFDYGIYAQHFDSSGQRVYRELHDY